MNFFEQQAHARRHTTQLVILFAITVGLIVLACYFPAVLIANGIEYKRVGVMKFQPNAWRLGVLGYAAAVAGGIIFFGSLWKIYELSGGGAVIARRLGGRLVAPTTNDADERKLRNVVEEMAIASGVAVPQVFVMDNENGINAFAAGFSPNDAAIAVTRGCIQHLSRDELQGVIAHEFSHVLNGDMRLNIRLIGLLHGILVIGLIGVGLVRIAASGSRSKRSWLDAAFLILGAIIAAIGYIGVFSGRVIKASVSRQREFLADASAVDFTRNPDGIAGALKKIGGHVGKSVLLTSGAEVASHMLFGDGLSASILFGNLLATHPPLAERIRRIDPSFDGVFPRLATPEQDARRQAALAGGPRHLAARSRLAAQAAVAAATTIDPAGVVSQVAAPTIDHLAYGAALLDMLPETLRSAVREPTGAMAAVYALLLDEDQAQRDRQLAMLRERAEPEAVKETLRQQPMVAMLFAGLRLPMAELAVPALRLVSDDRYEAFKENVRRLILADSRVSVFEFAMQQLLLRRLAPAFGKVDRKIVRYRALGPLLPDCRVVLSLLARIGNREEEAARGAFASAMTRLWRSAPPPSERLEPAAARAAQAMPEILPTAECSLRVLGEALERLAMAAPIVKERVVDACARCVLADGTVTVKEAELLRAVTDALDCPLPPFLPSTGAADAA